jgi:hypothetical protein
MTEKNPSCADGRKKFDHIGMLNGIAWISLNPRPLGRGGFKTNEELQTYSDMIHDPARWNLHSKHKTINNTPETSNAWNAIGLLPNGMYSSKTSLRDIALTMFEHSKKMEIERDESRRMWSTSQDRMAQACELIAEIRRDEVNIEDECEKFLRAYAPHHLFPKTENNKSRLY